MKTIKFKCETVTPMFLAGADGRTPELRPPSIKGAMRFWWRAMNGHLSPEELKKRETEIFGGSGKGQGRSNVIIKMLEHDKLNIDKYRPLPHSATKTFPLPAIKPNEQFKVKLSLIKNIEFDGDNFAMEKLKNLFILTSILSGLGKRVRRGFGGFRILKIDEQPYDFEYNVEYILGLLNDISDGHYKIDHNKENKIILKENLNAEYPFLKEIQIGKECDSWEDLLKKIGEVSHNHNIDSLGFANGKNRLASPIYVSVLKESKNNKYLPIISTLNTAFEDNRKVDYKGQDAFKRGIL